MNETKEKTFTLSLPTAGDALPFTVMTFEDKSWDYRLAYVSDGEWAKLQVQSRHKEVFEPWRTSIGGEQFALLFGIPSYLPIGETYIAEDAPATES